MPEFEIRPRIGAGDIRFGMTRLESQTLLGPPEDQYRKGEAFAKSSGLPEPTLTDCYFGNRLQIYFDANDTVEYIEMNGPGTIAAVFNGKDLLTIPAEEAIELVGNVSAWDEGDVELPYSYTFRDLDLALWRPVVPEGPDDEEGRYFQSIGAGRPGYFRK